VPVDDALVAETLAALDRARQTAQGGRMPPPLVDSPKCPRCSLVTVCLPDETRAAAGLSGAAAGARAPAVQRTLFQVDEPTRMVVGAAGVDGDVRRLVPARDDLRPLYLNTQGLRVGKSGSVLKVHEKDKLVQEVRVGEICQLNVFGNIQLSTQAVQELCEAEVPIAYFSMGGWFYGVTHGLGVKNIYLRREQFRLADVPAFCLRLARALVAGKIRNQRTMLQRNHIEPPPAALVQMKCMMDDAEGAESMEQLLGIEGNAARVYFENFAGMIKLEEPGGRTRTGQREQGTEHREPPIANSEQGNPEPHALNPMPYAGATGGNSAGAANGAFTFDFVHRNRRPPRDAVNALLSLAYSVLAKDLTIVCHTVGFDPFLGFYHQPRFGRAALALDFMEPFRPLIADSAVLSAINTRMLSPRDFVQAGEAVALKPEGRKAFFRAYEQRMDALVTHPLFGYRVNYRRVLEIQARLLERVLRGELNVYPVFTTR
jgi:CRISPR-associated protein Cas1